ncbi:divergent PAP2 family protein [Candidatus Falkowbacteria bacterium]|nr:divergent PAP2 family protein [Candidatus Falkowbacteria bacterium]
MTYKLILVPILALVIAQLIKIIIDSVRGQFSWSSINKYGGMPSSHSAAVSALATEIGMLSGWFSPAFAIALLFAFITIRDAVGLRQYLGNHGKVLNMLIKDLPDYKEDKYPYLEERLGHTPLQALAGIVLGILIAIII